jgi:hypothetical protein
MLFKDMDNLHLAFKNDKKLYKIFFSKIEVVHWKESSSLQTNTLQKSGKEWAGNLGVGKKIFNQICENDIHAGTTYLQNQIKVYPILKKSCVDKIMKEYNNDKFYKLNLKMKIPDNGKLDHITIWPPETQVLLTKS